MSELPLVGVALLLLQTSLGKQFKQLLDIPESTKIGFVVFVSNQPGGVGRRGSCYQAQGGGAAAAGVC
jgi:hypothetical protein